MRALTLLGLLALAACSSSGPPDHVFAVFFTEDSAILDSPAQDIVNRAAAASKQFPGQTVNVAGYADRNGTPAATIAISKARADAVFAQLVADGVPPGRIKRSASAAPADNNPGVESRRVEIDIGD